MDWKSSRIDALLEQALVEDQAVRDATTNLTIDPNLRATASIIAREPLVVAGLGAVSRFLEIFARLETRLETKLETRLETKPETRLETSLDTKLDNRPQARPPAQTRFEVIHHPEIFDGVRARQGQVLAVIRGNARVLLSCERVILNLLQHLSGIATLTRTYVDAIEGTQARVLDTRKTVPGMRALEKYAVLCGGGTNHRLDLASGILIKNNHIALGGGLRPVLTRALENRSHGQRIQIEVRTPQELEDALECGAEAILLDNMTPDQVRRSVERIHAFTTAQVAAGKAAQFALAADRSPWIPTEASGGIVLQNIRAYAETGVNFISVGALTHSARAADISMSIVAG